MILAPAGISCVALGTFMALGYDGHRMQQTGAEPTCSCNLRMDQVVLAMWLGMGRPEAVSPPPSSSTCLLVLEKHPSQSCGDSVIQGDWGAPSKHRSCRQLGCSNGALPQPHQPEARASRDAAVHRVATRWRSCPLSAAAKSLQSYLTLCDPIDGSPPGSPVPGILQARTLEWLLPPLPLTNQLENCLFINICLSTWTAWRSNQSVLKEISPDYSLEGLMLKLKFQYFGYLMRRTNSLERVMLGKIESGREGGPQRMRWLDGITDLMDMSLSKL